VRAIVSSYPWRDGPLPIELVNTLFVLDGQPVDALATPDELADWLRANARHFPEPARGAAIHRLDSFRALRAAVRDQLRAAADGSPPPVDSLRVLNQLSQNAPSFPRLDWVDGEPRLTLVDIADLDCTALAIVTRASLALLGGADRQRIGACQAPGCVLFFLKEHRRRDWCSAACGNRARVARHYRRHRAAPPPEPLGYQQVEPPGVNPAAIHGIAQPEPPGSALA
jgi:predicted RNA-binding Zn ribbon-like protein